MEGHITHVVRLFVTSDELRKLADKIDEINSRAVVGNSLVVKTLDFIDVTVKIVADQK